MIKEQEYLLELIKRIDTFMKENEITYYLYGGSAIGAMRHQGFIPWDDDMDIIVDRTNFYKLMDKADRLPEDMGFISVETDPEFFKVSGFLYVKTNTCSSKSRMFMGGEAMGFTLDVFILDDMKSERTEEFRKSLILYEDVLEDAWIYHPDIVKYKDDYFRLKQEQKEVGKKKVAEKLKAELEKDAPEDSDKYVTRWCRSKMLQYDKDIFGEPKYVKFEDTMLPVPAKPEAMLRVEYGPSWYMLPPKEDQEIHDFAVVSSISYNNYYSDLSNFIDWEEAKEQLEGRKSSDIRRRVYNDRAGEYRNTFALERILMKCGIGSGNEQFMELFRSGRYEEFISTLEPLIGASKLVPKSKRSPECLPAAITAALIKALVMAGRYYDAQKVRDGFAEGRENVPDIAEACTLLEHVISCVEAMQDRDEDRLEKLLSTHYANELDKSMDFRPAEHIQAEVMLCGSGADEHEKRVLLSDCEDYLKTFPSNWDVVKAKADLLWETGDKEGARTLYETVLENTRNGLDILDINERKRNDSQ